MVVRELVIPLQDLRSWHDYCNLEKALLLLLTCGTLGGDCYVAGFMSSVDFVLYRIRTAMQRTDETEKWSINPNYVSVVYVELRSWLRVRRCVFPDVFEREMDTRVESSLQR